MLSSTLVSEPTVWVALLSLSGLLIAAVEDEESDDRCGARRICEVGSGEASAVNGDDIIFGMASEILGESGVIFDLYLTEHIIFSKPKEVICFSRPREVAMVLDGEGLDNALIPMDDVGGECDSSMTLKSSEANESTLADKSGTSCRPGLVFVTSIAGVVVICGWFSQHNVSLFHIRQLRFSSLRPFSIDSAHLEKTIVRM